MSTAIRQVQERTAMHAVSGMLLPVALSLSIGWGIRGNFGHEAGAMIPGALAALAAVICSARPDWHRRCAFFAAFGALGWCLGGSISYMQVIGYTHSGHSPSVLYGFFCLFVIGFLWGSMGGAGTALPAILSRQRLMEFIAPLAVWFVTLWIRDVVEETFVAVDPSFRQNDPLYWYDTDWTAALLGLVVFGAFWLARRRDRASALLLHMAVGWWMAFLVLVVALHLRMTPPRGDNWAGCLGMALGLLLFLQRERLDGAVFAMLTAGFIGGFGFAFAQCVKLLFLLTGWEANWHSVLEQSYGLINGIGIAAAMGLLSVRLPRVTEEPPVDRRADVWAAAFTMLFITYINLRKNPEQWVKQEAMPASMYWLPTISWFNVGYAAIAAAVLWLLLQHLRRPLPVLPAAWLGRAQLLHVLLLWWMVAGNFERALAAFQPQRLITEGVILLNAALVTALLLSVRGEPRAEAAPEPAAPLAPLVRRSAVRGMAGMVLTTLACWGITRLAYGDRFAGHSGLHIRFGPNATAVDKKPEPGKPHP